jgi:hypothetical protein
MIRDKHLPPDAKLDIDKCTDCSSGKQTRDSFKCHIDKATKEGAVIHSDVVGPLPHSVSGARYFVVENMGVKQCACSVVANYGNA